MLSLAIKMLVGDQGKYIGVLLGLIFTTFFMTQQPATFLGLLERTYGFLSDAGLADVWVMDPMVRFVDDAKPLRDTAVSRVRGIAGVGWAVPIYKGMARVRLENGNFQNSTLIGLDDATLIGGPAVMIEGQIADLRYADSVIVSLDSAQKHLARANPVAGEPLIPLRIGDVIEMNDRRAIVVGISQRSTTTAPQATVYTTYSRVKSYSPAERKMLSYVLVKAKAGVSTDAVIQNIRRNTELTAYTREEFQDKTLQYVVKNSPAFALFGGSALIGFLIGGLISGQTFYNFTLTNLRYLGVMKAMGATNRLLLKMITAQALMAGAISYGIGIGLTGLFSLAMRDVFVVRLNWLLLLLSGFAVLTVCVAAATLSLIKVMRLPPAEVFKT